MWWLIPGCYCGDHLNFNYSNERADLSSYQSRLIGCKFSSCSTFSSPRNYLASNARICFFFFFCNLFYNCTPFQCFVILYIYISNRVKVWWLINQGRDISLRLNLIKLEFCYSSLNDRIYIIYFAQWSESTLFALFLFLTLRPWNPKGYAEMYDRYQCVEWHDNFLKTCTTIPECPPNENEKINEK